MLLPQTVSGKETTTKALDDFCRDLCEHARMKGVDPVRRSNTLLISPNGML